MIDIVLSFIERYLLILYLVHIPSGFAAIIIMSILGLLAVAKYSDNQFSLERRGRMTYRLWLAFSIFMFIVIPTASVLALLTDNSFLLYMAVFLLYLNFQLILALLGKHNKVFNRVVIVIGLIVSYVMIGRGLLYAIQQQPVPATIVFFGVILAVISTVDLTTIFRASRIGLIIRNGVGSTLAATTAMVNIYVFRGELAWISWIIPTLLLTPVIVSVMFINDAYNKRGLKPESPIGEKVFNNIIALKTTLDA